MIYRQARCYSQSNDTPDRHREPARQGLGKVSGRIESYTQRDKPNQTGISGQDSPTSHSNV